MANHSNTHAHNEHKQYYTRRDKVVKGFEEVSQTLELTGKSIPLGLPGPTPGE